jgi:hypothetical protein
VREAAVAVSDGVALVAAAPAAGGGAAAAAGLGRAPVDGGAPFVGERPEAVQNGAIAGAAAEVALIGDESNV